MHSQVTCDGANGGGASMLACVCTGNLIHHGEALGYHAQIFTVFTAQEHLVGAIGNVYSLSGFKLLSWMGFSREPQDDCT